MEWEEGKHIPEIWCKLYDDEFYGSKYLERKAKA
jgi:hypothetical protein